MEEEEGEGCCQKTGRWMAEEWRSAPWRQLWKALLGEFIGTFLLTLFGCGAAIATDNFGWTLTGNPPDSFSYGNTYHVVVALGFGLTTATVVAIFQAMSGGHVNPAVTLGHMCSRRMNVAVGLFYFPVQFLGGCAGCGVLKVIKATMNHRDDVFPATVNTANGMHLWQGFVWEGVLAFHLCIMYLVVTDDAFPFMRFTSPLLIGTAVVVNHLAALYATAGTANPARAVAAALVSWKDFDQLWVFVVAPPVGAIIAAIFYVFVLKEEDIVKRERLHSIFGK